MSENIQSISQGTYTIGQTSATNFISGPGIKIDQPSEGVVRIGNDETLLWSGSYTSRTYTTTESPYNFSKIEFVPQYSDSTKFGSVATVRINENTKYISLQYQVPSTLDCRMSVNMSVASSGFTVTEGARLRLANYTATTTDTQTNVEPRLVQIWGINRISGSNA